jgi:hypothetical protein
MQKSEVEGLQGIGVTVKVGGMGVSVTVGGAISVWVEVKEKSIVGVSLATSMDSEAGRLQAAIRVAVNTKKIRFMMAFILHQERSALDPCQVAGNPN